MAIAKPFGNSLYFLAIAHYYRKVGTKPMLVAAYDYNPIVSDSGIRSALFGTESCENARVFCPTFTDSVCIKDSVGIDPCAGSGHILDYLFDVLMQIYTDYGYTTSEAVRSIIENNLYGLDIDDRAAQLAYFSVMMKARSYDRRFLTRKDEDGNPDIPQPHVYAIVESNELNQNEIEYFTNNDSKLKKDFEILVDELHDAKEYGSNS